MYPNGTAKGDLRQVAYLSIALSLTSLMGACGQQRLLDDGPSDVQRSDVEKPPAGTVRYRYVWDSEGVTRMPETGSWLVKTNLGYEVTVTPSFLVSASIQLTPCEEEDSTGTDLWDALFGVPSARAGHSSEYNPAAITQGTVESVHMLQDADAGMVSGLKGRFCFVHYLVAAGDKETQNLPDTLQMVDRSLFLEGTWRAAGSDEVVPFTVDTALAWGILKKLYPPTMYDISSEAVVLDSSIQGANVTVNRRARMLFDGIDFANLSPNTLPTRVLSAIFDATELVVETHSSSD